MARSGCCGGDRGQAGLPGIGAAVGLRATGTAAAAENEERVRTERENAGAGAVRARAEQGGGRGIDGGVGAASGGGDGNAFRKEAAGGRDGGARGRTEATRVRSDAAVVRTRVNASAGEADLNRGRSARCFPAGNGDGLGGSEAGADAGKRAHRAATPHGGGAEGKPAEYLKLSSQRACTGGVFCSRMGCSVASVWRRLWARHVSGSGRPHSPSLFPALVVFPMKIVVVEDEALIRGGLSFFCHQPPKHEVVGEAGDGRTGLDMILRLKPDLVVLDLGLPEIGGLDVMDVVRVKSPATKLLIVSGFLNEHAVTRTDKAGLRGFVDKGSSTVEDLLAAVAAVDEGGTWFSERYRMLVQRVRRNASAVGKILSDAEQEVLALAGKG